MVSLTPQISMMAMMAPAGVLSGIREVGAHLAVAQLDLDGLRFHVRDPAFVFASVAPGNLSSARALPANIISRSARCNRQRLDRRIVLRDQPAALLGIERRVGGEQACRRAEEGMPATRRRDLAVERGVGIEHLEIVDRRLLEARLLRHRVALRRAEEDLPEAETNLAGEIRDHAAHVMGDDLEVGQLVEDAGIDQPRHAGRGLVGPAEAEPDLCLGRLLARHSRGNSARAWDAPRPADRAPTMC